MNLSAIFNGVGDRLAITTVTEPLDQRPTGSCVSHAFGAMLSCRLTENIGHESPRYFHFCDLGLGAVGPEMGAFQRALVSRGFPFGVPIDSTIDSVQACPIGENAGMIRRYKVPRILSTYQHEDVIASLNSHRPVVADMTFDQFFENWHGSEVYGRNLEGFLYNHSICIVGYNERRGYWIAKNSYGMDWGEFGFFRMAYDTCSFLTTGYPAYLIQSVNAASINLRRTTWASSFTTRRLYY